jgi:UDPglucose 6-dehydrogenase
MIEIVSVIGGEMALPVAAAIASRGVRAVCLVEGVAALDAVQEGRTSTFYEPGLQELLGQVGDQLRFVDDIGHAIRLSDATMVIAPTPNDETQHLPYIVGVCKRIGQALESREGDNHIIVIISTVRPGAMLSEIQTTLEAASGLANGQGFGLCYSPLFVTPGNIVEEFLNPSLVLIGEGQPFAGALLSELYRALIGEGSVIIRTSFINAELAKLALSGLLATQAAFGNYMAQLCESTPGGDVDIIRSIIAQDARAGWGTNVVGPYLLYDVHTLAGLSDGLGIPATLPNAVIQMNEDALLRLVSTITAHTTEGGTITILGLAYKQDTHITEGAVGEALRKSLSLAGWSVYAYDPVLTPDVDAQTCIDAAQTVVITLPYPEFAELNFWPNQTVIDCWHIFWELPGEGKYIVFGKGPNDDEVL